jgi:NosR/NirI family transcriptional regulator, nitrous oxide reductase regulator
MTRMFARYARWLHTGWPAGTVEKLPETFEGGATRVPGVRVVGDLTGVPLLKFSADTGARAIAAFVAERDFAERRGRDADVLDVAIVGGGVSGIAAALEAKAAGLRFAVFEAAAPFSTVANFPKAKPIFTYPSEMTPAGALQVSADVKEALLEELEQQRTRAGIDVVRAHVERVERRGAELVVHVEGGTPVRALRVVIAIGRSGNYRALGVAGEKLDKVFHRLYDPADYAGQDALVVGGGDSALETAVALADAGARVTLSYRGQEFARAKPENVERLQARGGAIRVLRGTRVVEIRARDVVIAGGGGGGATETLPNDVVFAMIGREAPLDFFRRSGIPIRGEWRARTFIGFAAFLLFCVFVYNWKAGTSLNAWFSAHRWFPFNIPETAGHGIFGRALIVSLRQPGFYYSFAYSVCVAAFGWRRIRRRKTPYITRQTLTLAAIQIVPLFLIPYFVLPMLGYAGVFDSGALKNIADHLFPVCSYDYGREYWRAFGLVLAWPLFFWNLFTSQPMSWWLAIGLAQTFVIIPLIVHRWGKGAYCGWICSCGALAETLGDDQRGKMPHGARWNRLNLVGQVILALVSALFVARVVTWYWPSSAVGRAAAAFYDATFYAHAAYDYYHVVDLFLAGVVGVGLYFWFSGRVWCRFACPLAALMHIYARFSRFRIFADKKKCISCNLCTSVCHQGIDVMSFANKGAPMIDPECVRCSACVQTCPTGTLRFGRVGAGGAPVYDALAASPVLMKEPAPGEKRVGLRVVG